MRGSDPCLGKNSLGRQNLNPGAWVGNDAVLKAKMTTVRGFQPLNKIRVHELI